MKIPLLALPCLLACAASAETLMDPRFEDLLRAAKSQNKPILLEFYTTWCPSCKDMERLVFPDPKVLEASGRFVFARYDADAERGAALRERFFVRSFPTFLFLDPLGREKNRRLGSYDAPGEMVSALEAFLSPASPAKREDALAELEKASERGDEKRCRELLKKVSALDPDGKKGLLPKGLYALGELLRGKGRHSEAAGLQMDLAARFPGSEIEEDVLYQIERNLRFAALDKAAALYRRRISEAPGKAAAYLAFANMSGFNRYRLAEGIRLAKKAVELEPKNAGCWASLAKLYHTKGDLKSAVDAMRKAAGIQSGSRIWKERLARYEAELAAIDGPR
jgi:thioredoxin-like negative regulator of GroEL